MAAPTPVSALVHSSTLVTAGVYLIIRFHNVLFESEMRNYLFVVGIFTMLIAGVSAILETDIKKIIALSTLRQLGVIMMTLGANYPTLSFYHLVSHAYFKAILFMCAGLIIHNMSDYQDIRNMGSSDTNIPLSMRIISTANLRLCGLPFIRGFYSKDLILEVLIMQELSIFLFTIIMCATLLTLIYSLRLRLSLSGISLNFRGYFRNKENDYHIHLGMFMLLPFAILGGINIGFMLILKPSVIYLPSWIKLMVLILITVGVVFILSRIKGNIICGHNYLMFFSRNIWHMPNTLSPRLSISALRRAKLSAKISEISWLEILLYHNTIITIIKFSFLANSVNSSYFIYPAFAVLLVIIF